LLADWKQYGLALETGIGETGYSGPLLVPCLQYKVTSPVGLGASREQVVHLFILFEQVPASRGELEGNRSQGAGTDQWEHLINITAALRSNLVSVISLHCVKFQKAVHSALNKLLYNYTKYINVSVAS
jgi:hypothetical protein